MGRLYVNQTLEKQIRQYCEMNNIEDINAFANRCLLHGFNIVKFGTSPKDNVERENKGIKDIKKNESRKKKDPLTKDEGKPKETEESRTEEPQEEVKRVEETKQGVTVRKIRIIKKG